ncbi:LysR family transcriptional regulator [Burkholderia sp. AU31624]|uniref:LysR family transcriptional regulator n=1 Tax=Burkholderia sp. AU31624 TaxID=2879629 RepID=UPI001CF10449|nr:LysR family transcriptional regulator [Burkholderia sp. AU31624]MCA8252560.1 LysR family transcriptional regulator [Burkholderia sp. AU31624]
MNNLNWVQSFVQVAETRSFVATARLQGVSASAVSKSVARLEEHLNVRLFHRSTRSISLTAEGTLFLQRCRRILDELTAAEIELQQSVEAPRGRLRVSLPLISMLSPQLIAAFLRRYPEVELEIDYSDRLVDVIEEGFDAVLRTGYPDDSRLISRKLGTCRRVIVAAPAYLDQHGTPEHPHDLKDHKLLLYRYPSNGKIQQWPLADDVPTDASRFPVTMVSNSSTTLLAMASEGLGIACLLDYEVKERLASGALRAILDWDAAPSVEYRVLWPSGQQPAPKVRAFVDFLAEHVFPSR